MKKLLAKIKSLMDSHPQLAEVLRFAFTGGVCFLIEYAALVLFKEALRMDVLIATPLAFLVSVIVNYLMCVRWVFSGAQEGSRKAQIGFVITSGMGLVINWALMALLTLQRKLHHPVTAHWFCREVHLFQQ